MATHQTTERITDTTAGTTPAGWRRPFIWIAGLIAVVIVVLLLATLADGGGGNTRPNHTDVPGDPTPTAVQRGGGSGTPGGGGANTGNAGNTNSNSQGGNTGASTP